jgi:sRNA-binding carbon storage regulator CsrA
MLIVECRVGEKIVIGVDVVLSVEGIDVRANQARVRIGILDHPAMHRPIARHPLPTLAPVTERP